MAKKKKTQLKPVARGFATTSVPKKVVPVEEPEPEVEETTAEAQGESTAASGDGAKGDANKVDEFDPAKAEEESLQNVVDKLQDKTEREISRSLKAIEFDRRLAKGLPSLSVDPVLVSAVLNMIKEDPPSGVKPLPYFHEAEDKVLARLGITYGTLRRLGFAEERVQECLKAIVGVDLDEAFDWLCLNCDEEELVHDKDDAEKEGSKPARTLRAADGFPQTPLTPNPSLSMSDGDLRHFDNLQLPSDTLSPHTNVTNGSRSESDDDMATIKSRILAAYSADDTDSTPSLDAGLGGPGSDMDPHVDYAKIKLKMVELSLAREKDNSIGRGQGRGDAMKELERRLETVKKHYFFTLEDAEAEFEAERTKAEARALDARLRGSPSASQEMQLPSGFSNGTKAATKRRAPRPKQLLSGPKVVVEPVAGSSAETEGDSDEGGMFGTMLDEMPVEETSKTGTVIRIRDMAVPKHWGGRTPKLLLMDTVQKQHRGKFAAISFRRVGGASRAYRAAVSIRWEGGRSQEWAMDEEGCHDQTQAEHFISTVALHAITFIPQPGFASASVLPGSQTSFRLLPPAFRDLWDELEAKRKETEDASNRRAWATLREILEPKMAAWGEKVSSKIQKEPVATADESSSQKHMSAGELSPAQMQAGFLARQCSPLYQDMLMYRNQLPIAPYRGDIISTLERSPILVLSGETGCGKSTQVPTFILEDSLSRGNPCRILVTEPRRISAISLAQRVSNELGDEPGTLGTLGSLVGYTIRLESNTTRNTRLTFVTNGIALRMLEGGSGQGGKGTALDDITHIVVDEVHERSIDSDFLLIVLKSLLEQRKNLKIILMSATLDAEKISNFFGGCPMMAVPGRTYPVEVRYLEDAIEFAGWSVKEGSQYAKRRNDKFSRMGKGNKFDWNEDTVNDDEEDQPVDENAPVKFEKRYSQATVSTVNLLDERLIPYDLIMRLLERLCFEDNTYMPYSAAILIFMPGLAEIRRMNDFLQDHPVFGAPQGFRIYPLHSTISSEGQGAVFDVPPIGVRKIVIATNIAETGITIPDITCVIDSGKHREMRFDEKRQISKLIECYIARSNAMQRRGRAGRVQAGLCFHLFTNARFETQMAEHPLPEMLRLSLSDLALRIKILKVKLGTTIEDVLSRALDPPSSINIQRAVSALVEVKALTSNEDITPMGRLLSKLPTDVHLGKFLLMAVLFRCLDPALTIAATLNLKSPFVTPFGYEQDAERAKLSFKLENSDFLTIHNAFASWRRACANGASAVRTFCRKSYLSYQNLQQIEEMRQQFLGYLVDSSFIQVDESFERELSRARYSRSRQARFVSVPTPYDENGSNHALIHSALAAGLYPKLLVIDGISGQIRTLSNGAPASFHPSSVNFRTKAADFGTNHLSYFTIMQSKKLYAWETAPVDDLSLLLLCGDVESKVSSNSVFLDRRIKFRLPSAKANLALAHLRDHAAAVVSARMRGKDADDDKEIWWELLLDVLAKKELAIGKGEAAG